MPMCRSSAGARATCVIECYKHIAPLALRSEEADSNELLRATADLLNTRLPQPGFARIQLNATGAQVEEAGSNELLLVRIQLKRP
jgi:hypothetical protein